MTKVIVDTLPFPQSSHEELLSSPLYRKVIHLSTLLSLGYVYKTSQETDMNFLKGFLLEQGFYANREQLDKTIPHRQQTNAGSCKLN